MAETSTTSPAPSPPFRAVLTAHRSLGPRGFAILMAVLGAVSLVMGLAFLSMGAWPVMGFLGLDVLIVYIAFRLNYRSGRIYEVVEIGREDLQLLRIHPSGRRERFRLDTYWTRIMLDEQPDGRTALAVGARGEVIPFGGFLTDQERRDLASELRAALVAARGGPRI